jgi:hypothetical protein
MSEVINKFLRWLFFGVLVSLVPILCSYLNLLMKHKGAAFEAIIGDGGLLFISAICAGARGEVIGSGTNAAVYKIISAGCVVITLLISALSFASVFEGRMASTFDGQVVATTSIWIFFVGMVPCAACIALSEL